MLPYFYIPTLQLGPVTIYTWGTMVALGAALGIWIAHRVAKRWGLNAPAFLDAAFWILLGAFVGARLGHVFFYEPAFYQANPIEALKIWHGGLSSYGGFVGGAMVGAWYLRRRKLLSWAYADCIALGLAPGWTIGRVGCFLIHDHPGTLTSFVLGVRYPDGTVRHDLGLYDGLLTFFISLVFLVMWWRNSGFPRPAAWRESLPAGRQGSGVRGNGRFILVLMLLYGTARFFLDFLRTTTPVGGYGPDARYLSLTPAQYASAFMAITAILLLKNRRVLSRLLLSRRV